LTDEYLTIQIKVKEETISWLCRHYGISWPANLIKVIIDERYNDCRYDIEHRHIQTFKKEPLLPSERKKKNE